MKQDIYTVVCQAKQMPPKVTRVMSEAIDGTFREYTNYGEMA